MLGWIALHRKILDHWIFKENRMKSKFEAWLIILMEVNHSLQKVNMGNQLFICERGESLNSIDTWATLFGWTKSKVKRFFILLEKDSMIVRKVNTKSTHLKVLNYDSYQNMRTADEPQVNRKRTASEPHSDTNNNVKNDKNEKKGKKLIQKPPSVSDSIWEDFKTLRKARNAPITETAIKGIQREANKAKISLEDAMQIMIESNWTGFKLEWYENKYSNAIKNTNLMSKEGQQTYINGMNLIRKMELEEELNGQKKANN